MSASDAAPLIELDECESTQSEARALLDAGRAPHGTCVVARRQRAGRGRRGRVWLDVDEALLMSLVLDVHCPHAHAPRITLATARALVESMDALGVAGARVKWPNDLVIPFDSARTREPPGPLGELRKVAGVLVEVARSSAAAVDCAVVGVGVNVRMPREQWPAELAPVAGALSDAGFGGAVDDVLRVVRPAIVRSVSDALASDAGFAAVLDVLRARSATLGRRVSVDGVVGVARAIDGEGALIVADDAGHERVVRAGDVWIA